LFFKYLGRELSRRSKQAVVIGLGLALGIALVVTVSSAAAGVRSAQTQVLHSLYGVGTDVSVTQTATAGSGGPQRFGFGGGTGTRPTPGTHFSRDTLRPTPGQAELASSQVTAVSKLPDVNAATASLVLDDTSISGTFGSFGGFGSGGGTTPTTSGSPPPISFSSFSVAGVQQTSTGVGLLSASEISAGRYFTSADSTSAVAIVATNYASQHSLKVGSSLKVAGKALKVVGLAATPSGSATDVFVPLGEAQKLADLAGKVNTIYVSAVSASDVGTVQSEIQKLMPKATITTSADLANEVTGSLSSAANLAENLGKWLAIAALLAAFLIAALLMMGAVSRRVREFGTLKALGWRTRRIVGQVMGEGVAIGAAGGVLGVGFGLLGAKLVSVFSPTLSATEGPSFATGGGGFGGGGFGGGGFGSGGGGGFGSGSFPRGTGGGGGGARNSALTHTVSVHMVAAIQGGTLGLGIGLAIAGGLIAGAFGAWRAARLRPAAALRRVE
jgi:putative ABC transport system permease protein